MKYVIEHLNDEVFEWCLLEYRHISQVVGKDNLIFTNIPKEDAHKFKNLGEVHTKSVIDLNLSRCCILEMEASKELEPSDAKNFEYVVFGGILGDDPPRGRNEVLQKLYCESRSLGSKQMSTDTAAMVTHMILNGTKMKDITFQDTIELETGENDAVVLPYRYVIKNGKPILPPGLFEMLRDQEGF